MLLLICSCRNTNSDVTEDTRAEVDTTEKVTDPVTESIEEMYVDPLTGKEIKKDLSGERCVAIMIKNDRVAAPQPGLSKADIVYEAAVEGGLTRFVALFSDREDFENVGPVIDSRYYFYTLAASHDAVFVQAGTTSFSRKQLLASDVKVVDALSGELEPAFRRDNSLVEERGAENSIVTDGKSLEYAIDGSGISTVTTEGYIPAFKFEKNNNSAKSGSSCSVVSIPYSNNHTPYFKYSTLEDEYVRYQYGEIHRDHENSEALRYKNVIIMFTEVAVADKNTGELSYELYGKGNGYYMCSGKYIPVIWSREEGKPVRFFSENGTDELVLEPGKTFVSVCSENLKTKVNMV